MSSFFILESLLILIENDAAARFLEGRNLLPDVGSERASTKARDWIGKCVATHDDCTCASDMELPLHLLDVNFGDRYNDIRLVQLCSPKLLLQCWKQSKAIFINAL